ncbi:fungal-specific transcription factor domain-containing protein [Mycena alexandri]|uniref:Fungal-specific transcription factor domain-containing protein n=1 Tax=Mycena alexandri TaxID=1745969 RepID=A0AAD6XFN3_9AGAR|nr:fungal-specific transcription factor domain-containing protein [Mycena alexandri]
MNEANPASSTSGRKSQITSCAECRRLKLRCDRVFPCASCIRRGCANLCPLGTLEKGKRGFLKRLEQSLPAYPKAGANGETEHSEVAMFVARDNAMTKRIQELEAALVNAGITVPGPSGLNAAPPEPSPSQDNEGRAKRQRTSSLSDSAIAASPSTAERDSAASAVLMPVDTTDVTLGFGTLTIDDENRSRYIGPSGGASYLNADLWKMNPNQTHSRGNSQDNTASYDGSTARSPLDSNSMIDPSPRRVSHLEEVLAKMACLPPRDEAVRIARLYFKNAAFMYEIIPEAIFFNVHLPAIYPDGTNPYIPSNLHVLALAGMVLSLGMFFDLSLPPENVGGRASDFYDLAVAALNLSIPLKVDTIPAVQTLHLMTLYFLSTRAESGGDPAWQLLGMAMRSIQAQGCHRDGSRWGLPPRELEERRRVFWETHMYDRLQSFTFGRPYAQSDSHHDCEMPRSCDTPLPYDSDPSNILFSHTHWHMHKFRFGLLLGRIVDLVFSVKHPPYSMIMQLDREINEHYDALPAWIICDAVKNPVKALPMGRQGAGLESDMRRDAQIASLANMYFLTLLHLHRGPFCRALMLGPKNFASSRYSTSIVSLTNAARAIINIARGLFALHPAITSRMWYWIFHSFTAAVCLAVLVIVAPGHPLSPAAFESMQAAVELFQRADGERAKSAAMRAGWLAQRARQAMDAYRSNPTKVHAGKTPGAHTPDGDAGSAPSKLEFPTSNMRGGPEDLLGTSTKLIRAQPQGDTTLPSPSALLAGVLPPTPPSLHTSASSSSLSGGNGTSSAFQFSDRRQENGGYARVAGQSHWPQLLPLHPPSAPRVDGGAIPVDWTQDFNYTEHDNNGGGVPQGNGGNPPFNHQQDQLQLPFQQFQQQPPFNPSAYISVDGFDLSGFIRNGANAWLFEGERTGEEELLSRQQHWAEHMH